MPCSKACRALGGILSSLTETSLLDCWDCASEWSGMNMHAMSSQLVLANVFIALRPTALSSACKCHDFTERSYFCNRIVISLCAFEYQ